MSRIDWKPISLAPKDGRKIMLCAVRRGYYRIEANCYWRSASPIGELGMWVGWYDQLERGIVGDYPPTHWDYLPDRPNT